jgi:hypothetical protein
MWVWIHPEQKHTSTVYLLDARNGAPDRCAGLPMSRTKRASLWGAASRLSALAVRVSELCSALSAAALPYLNSHSTTGWPEWRCC